MKLQDAWLLILLVASGCRSDGPKDSLPDAPPQDAGPREEPPSSGDHFRIDPSASRMTARVGVAGILSAFGHEHTMAIREFEGEIVLTPGRIAPARVRMTARPASISETGTGFSDADRRKIDEDVRAKALEAAQFDLISFRSTSVSAKNVGNGEYDLGITGLLQLHGVKKVLTVPARLTLEKDALKARGEFKITHGDFKIERLSAAGGTVKASDEITVSFEFRARRSD